MSERSDVYVAGRMLLDASILLYSYYPEISNPLLNLAKEILKRIDISNDEELQKYVSILSKEDEEQKRYESILSDTNDTKKEFETLYNNYKDMLINDAGKSSKCSECRNKCESISEDVDPKIMKTLLDIRKKVIEKLG